MGARALRVTFRGSAELAPGPKSYVRGSVSLLPFLPLPPRAQLDLLLASGQLLSPCPPAPHPSFLLPSQLPSNYNPLLGESPQPGWLSIWSFPPA